MNKHTEFWKIFFLISLGIIGVVALIFMAMMGYYLWQLRYGNPDTITQLSNQYSDKFTALSQEKAPTRFENPQSIIRAKNPVLGDPQAPITIIAFMDFECPYSQESYPILKKTLDQFGPAVRFVFKQLPLSTIHPNAMNASLASACAEEQGKFWQFEDALFSASSLNDNLLYSIAQSQGLELGAFTSCFNSKKFKSVIDQDLQDAIVVGIRGTPTFVIDTEVIEGVPSEEEWSTLILKHLK